MRQPVGLRQASGVRPGVLEVPGPKSPVLRPIGGDERERQPRFHPLHEINEILIRLDLDHAASHRLYLIRPSNTQNGSHAMWQLVGGSFLSHPADNTGACDDCVVTVLLAGQSLRRVELDNTEADAIDNLAEAGLVPKLRLLKRAGNE